MDYELFEYFTTDNISGKKCNAKWLSKNNSDLYNSIINWCDYYNELREIEFKRKVYHFLHKLTIIPMCEKCSGSVNYRRLRDGYNKFCSDKCVKSSETYKEKWKKTWLNNNRNGEFIEKRNKTILEKYESIEEYKNIVDNNKKKTVNEKYGVDYIFESDEFKKNRKKVLLNKYGDENWNNKEKTKRTRISNGTQIGDIYENDFSKYKKLVINRTLTIYRNNEKLINPYKLKRSHNKYHIDHKYSIKMGFLNNIPLEIITHPFNLHMMWWFDNISKQDRCLVTKFELLDGIINYEKDVIVKHSSFSYKYEKDYLSYLCEKNKNINYDN